MTFPVICSIISSVLFCVSSIWYVSEVAKQRVLPSVATFLVLSLINASQLASVVAKHAWLVLPFALISLASSTIVAIIGLKRKKFYLELPDKVGFIGALIGFLLWLVTNDPVTNLVVISITISVSFAPVIIKSFKRPDLESILPWQVNLIASVFLLMTINSSALSVWLVPVRQIILVGLLNLGLYRGQLKLRGKTA